MDLDALKRDVASIRWWHTIDLGHGIVTPGLDDSTAKLEQLGLPRDLHGRTVLDIGAADGFFSFEAERRGAKRVLATDTVAWHTQSWGSKAGFELARKAIDSKVEDMEIDVLDLSPHRTGMFDVVLFLGVLYHMRHPLLALERIASVTEEQLILETHVDMLGWNRAAMAFYPQGELEDDPTNWWGPNPLAVEAMLKTVGFQKVTAVSGPYSLTYRASRALYRRVKRRKAFFETLRQDRMVFHAWR